MPFLARHSRRIDPPRLRSRRNQHGARLRTRDAQLLPRILHAVAGTGDLTAIEGVDVRIADRRGDDVDPRQIDFEFLSQQHGQRGVDALSHFRAVDDDGDRIVRGHLEPRIQLRRRPPGLATGNVRRRPAASSRAPGPPPAAPCVCKNRGGSSWPTARSRLRIRWRQQFGRTMNRLADPRIGTAAADVARHGGVDLGIARVRIALAAAPPPT